MLLSRFAVLKVLGVALALLGTSFTVLVVFPRTSSGDPHPEVDRTATGPESGSVPLDRHVIFTVKATNTGSSGGRGWITVSLPDLTSAVGIVVLTDDFHSARLWNPRD